MTTQPGTAPAPIAAAATPATRPLHVARLACDSDDLASLIGTPFVRTYADLITSPKVLDELRSRFPDSIIELIDRGLGDPGGIATIADVESGALTIAQLPAWFDERHGRGLRDLVSYCSLDNLPAVIKALDGRPHWNWIAWFGHLFVPERPDAQVQFAPSSALGIHVDLTLVPNYRYRPTLVPVGQAAADLYAAIGAGAVPGAGPVVLPADLAAAVPPPPALADASASALAPAAATLAPAAPPSLDPPPAAPHPAAGLPAELNPHTAFLAPTSPTTAALAAYFHAGRLAEHLGSMERDLAGLRTILRSGIGADVATALLDLIG